MNQTILLLAVLMMAVSSALMSAPRVVCSTPSLTPESVVDVIFERPVVHPEALGELRPMTHLAVAPELSGSMIWVSPVMARLQFDGAPEIGTTHSFSIPPGLVHLDGSAIPAGRVMELAAEPFMVRSAQIRDRWEQSYQVTETSFLVVFNDAVEASMVGPFVLYRNGDGETIGARVRRATVEEAGYFGRTSLSWGERALPPGDIPERVPAEPLATAVVVTPERSLGVGRHRAPQVIGWRGGF